MLDHGTVMYARGRSTHGQMKSPSIAQRGEGGVRGGSGELRLLSSPNPRRSVMPESRRPSLADEENDFKPLSGLRKQL